MLRSLGQHRPAAVALVVAPLCSGSEPVPVVDHEDQPRTRAEVKFAGMSSVRVVVRAGLGAPRGRLMGGGPHGRG
jgi:hypothetical protein